jgi:hypothetical protein
MRVCWFCQQVNGDTDTQCGRCGSNIERQVALPPGAYVERKLPDVVGRRNRSARLLLVTLPFAVALTLWFWLGFIPAVYQDADAIRATQLRQRQQQIEAALEACRRDTGGVPARRLAVLQQYGVKAGDMTAGAKPGQWRGPYLPGGAFPLNPFRPQDGSAGWRYTTNGDEGSVAPAHMQP